MLRCHPSKLTRTAFNIHYTRSINPPNTTSPINPFYHQSLFQSQFNPSPHNHPLTMSGSALDQLKELMSMIDEYETANKNKPKQQPSEQEQKYPYQSLPSTTINANISPSIFKTNIPTDIVFRPKLPQGHTSYSWNYNNIYITEQKQPPKSQPKIKSKSKDQKGKPAKGKGNKRKIIPPKMLKAGEKDNSGKKYERRDHLRSIEKDIQNRWDKSKVFESNPISDKPKFMCTFPYPYMNGYLHLGHAFTITKAEFRAGYERLKGKNVLFPFAFHCTGMPIAAAAKKIETELKTYGNPPKFPQHNDLDIAELEHKQTSQHSHGHSKLQSKKSKKKYQWEIMREFDLNDDEISKFADSHVWLEHFPPIGKKHLREFGLKVDWRRSFITTEANPYYNKFIEWQFLKLQADKRIEFGNRPTIFSPSENQPCADHDRSSGETVKPQQYTLIKMELLCDNDNINTPFINKNGDKLCELYKLNKKIFMVAATLRPETMYGQTNCFVLPRGEYLAIECKNEIYICSEHSARNMSWQEFTSEIGKYNIICKCEGWDLLGRALVAPNAIYEKVYVLPLTTIKMDKGTGIVTSVPSDAPSDYAALKDAKNDKNFRDKYYLTDEMVLPYDVVEIIRINEFKSNKSAVDLCEKYKIKSQNDATKLEEIKQLVYKYGFAQGVMLVGHFKGEKVSVAKEKCQKELIDSGNAAIYWEPEDTVLSRTGCKCVVAFCDQWFLKYGIQNPIEIESKENEWQQSVKKHIENRLECYNKVTKDNFLTVIDWLHSWACSREFGLGTKLPWDPKWVIESLSDSTIYMAYYTIAHYLQNDCMNGISAGKNKINSNDLTPEIFDCIFCGGDVNGINWNKIKTLNKELILKMRAEFEYYYPMDLRVSGKDLIFNHLTMSLYNHAAIWPGQSKERWPQSYFTNGWALLDSDKMSKSTGNFLTISQCIELYGADATRLALANAGDTLEDANFETDVANKAILDLTRWDDFVSEIYETIDVTGRDGKYNAFDLLFENAINLCIYETDLAYKQMKFRDVLTFGYYKLQNFGNYYVAHSSSGLNKLLIKRYIIVQLLLLSPICPHICEYLWNKIHRSDKFIVNELYPTITQPIDIIKTLQFDSLQRLSHQFRNQYNKDEKDRRRKLNKCKKGSDKHAQFSQKLNGANVVISDDYKKYHKVVLNLLLKIYDENTNTLTIENWKQYLLKEIGVGGDDGNEEEKVDGGQKKKKKKKKLTSQQQEQLAFASYLIKEIMPNRKKDTFNESLPYNEFMFLNENIKLLFHEIDIDLNKVKFYKESDKNAPKNIKQKCKVGDPAVKFIFVD